MTARVRSPFVDECIAQARGLVEGRSIIMGGMPLAGATRQVEALRALGSGRCFVVASGTGTGPLPSADDADSIVVVIDAPDMMSEMRATERLLADPPPDVVAAIDRFDPDREALVLIAWFEPGTSLGDRPAFGPRRPEWVVLEDKTVCDALFDACRVPRPPSRVVRASFAALREAASALDRGPGTVWSGDARDGFNGGGTYVRWVHGDDDGTAAAAFFADGCNRVRVAPFVDGVSCSIHGFVTDDGTAVFRPVELVNLRRASGDKLQYAGCATYWDPSASDREEMRDAARRLGEQLRTMVDYRGCFTLDGIMGVDGFVATECNPRPGAGISYVATGLPHFPFGIVQYLAAAGQAGWLRAADLEATVVEAGDRVRWGGGWTPISIRIDATRSEPLVHDARGFRLAADGETADATLTLGPGALGGFLRVELDPNRTRKGPSIGPLLVDAFAYADATHGTGIGPLRPAAAAR